MILISPNHINPAFHATLFDHYTELLNRPDIQSDDRCRKLLQDQLDYHRDQYNRMVELYTLAGELRVPVTELLHMAKLVEQKMAADQTITLDYDNHRMVVKDQTGTVISWLKTNSINQ